MLTTTQAYKDAVYAPSRTVVARVTLDITDVTAESDVSSITTTTELASMSDKAQLNNNVRLFTYKLATLEQDRFKLDGSFSFPDSVLANNGEVGFVSSGLCDSAGVFSSAPTITVVFGTTHSSAGCTLTFDPDTGEVATDFSVSVYNASDVLIQTINKVGNTEVTCQVQGQFENYKKIIVTITKWSVGNRRSRIAELDFGIIKTYTNDNLISCELIEEFEMTGGTMPSPEFKFTVDNLDRAFNILNPTGYHKYLQQRQKVIAELGVETSVGVYEYVPLGEYLLWEWLSEEGSLTATFTTRTNLDLMSNYTYERLVVASKSLHALAVEVFAICGITNYSLDAALLSITTNSLAKKTDCKTLIQMIAIAGCANLYVTRDNVITIKQLTLGAPVDTVDFDNIYQEPKIELERVTKQVSVAYWTNLDTSVLVSVVASGVDIGDTLTLDGNTLINTSARASAVATWILAQKSYRAKYSVNWRGNPAQELADVIAIENTYGANMNARIVKTQLTYQGYLQANTEAKGAVN